MAIFKFIVTRVSDAVMAIFKFIVTRVSDAVMAIYCHPCIRAILHTAWFIGTLVSVLYFLLSMHHSTPHYGPIVLTHLFIDRLSLSPLSAYHYVVFFVRFTKIVKNIQPNVCYQLRRTAVIS